MFFECYTLALRKGYKDNSRCSETLGKKTCLDKQWKDDNSCFVFFDLCSHEMNMFFTYKILCEERTY